MEWLENAVYWHWGCWVWCWSFWRVLTRRAFYLDGCAAGAVGLVTLLFPDLAGSTSCCCLLWSALPVWFYGACC